MFKAIIKEYCIMQPEEKLVVSTNNGIYIATYQEKQDVMMNTLREFVNHISKITIFDYKRMDINHRFVKINNKLFTETELTFMS